MLDLGDIKIVDFIEPKALLQEAIDRAGQLFQAILASAGTIKKEGHGQSDHPGR